MKGSLFGRRVTTSGGLLAWLAAALVAALLCAPAASGRSSGKDPEALREAARIHRERGELEEARDALRAAIELAPDDTSLYEELADVFRAEGRGNEGKTPRILEVVEEVSTEEAAKLVGDLLDFEIRDAEGLIGGWKPRDLGILAGLALLLVVILKLLAREMRGRGDLVVSIELPQRRRGTFSVRLSRKPAAKHRVAEA